ncbi:S8 family peptidase [Crocosphaera watsonii WH 8501]|uniref:Peptidase S8 and S53, subtilisin, kexin, sedolisin n=4 Tax=Crocosphaera watsonii TaxID=263511 RepID=Q4C3M1_CROWT|nr:MULTISPECIES: S8 family peptidase [Crocosphaera]EAM50759.1 Peptidase S8 and S53, subtilisin, kexin, sedolisin [Crocosphaera watsonii WH 8501]EHJ12648.1 Peptidase S8 and S53, subtilisin, kexin, sedolisin [Crocosphaera watsonii WH 0003]MCH2248045.1 S8 family peptidase [Crocosphaera sp.]
MKKLLFLFLFIVGLWVALANFKGLATQGDYESIIVNFREDVSTTTLSEQIEAIASNYNQSLSLNSVYAIDEHIYTLTGDKELLKNLKKSPLNEYVDYIEPNYIYSALETPNDPDYSKQWNLHNIHVERAWEETKGEGITVAVIDSGVSRVPDLRQTEFVPGYDFVNDRKDARDDNGHGTHVAGTIAQSTNNNYGVAGVAYQAKIMPLKVLSAQGGGSVSDIADAIRFAADNEADIINMSLGGGGESQVMKDAIDYAYNKGVVIIAAAGNSNQNAASYPARYPKVISVSALDATGKKAPYSNYGAGVDISAPGGSEEGKILQETIDPSTGQAVFSGFQGTSMAAPHVAGVAALIKATGVKEPEEVFAVLTQSSRKVEEDKFNYYGSGQLDAGEAVKLAVKGQITFRDFFRWLRDSGYLNPRFWIDGGMVALLPKLLMVLGSYLLAFLLRNYFPFAFTSPFNWGLVLGSSGLFFLQGIYVFDLPQWPFRVMGSSIPELANSIEGTSLLNPFLASVLIPFALVAILLGHNSWKWFAIGTSLGVAACLTVHAIMSPAVMAMPSLDVARAFLGANAFLCVGLACLASKKS